MRAKIKQGNKTAFEINTSNRWAYIYLEYFGHDIIPDLVPLIDTFLGIFTGILNGEETDPDEVQDALYGMEYTTALNVIWALAKNANDDIPDAPEWYDGFEKFELDEIFPQVFEKLITTMVSRKKLELLQTQGKAVVSQFIRSSSQEQTEG